MGRHRKEKIGWSGRASGIYLSLVCAYAPTAKTPPSIKLKFYGDLQDTMDRIPHNDILVMLGDFNARIGVLDTGNDVGEEFLEFCTLNQFSIMNTWFQRWKSIKGLRHTKQQRNVT